MIKVKGDPNCPYMIAGGIIIEKEPKKGIPIRINYINTSVFFENVYVYGKNWKAKSFSISCAKQTTAEYEPLES